MKKLRNESGQTLVMVALSMAVLLGFTAFATDVGVMLHTKRAVQSAADSAAIAAGTAIGSHQDGVAAGVADATLNGFTAATDSNGNATTTVNIYTTPIDGHFAGQTGYVEAVITQQAPTFFMRLFSQDAMTIKARAVATYLGTGTACGYINNPKGSNPAGKPWGNSTIDSPTCGWLINGNLTLGASDAMKVAYIGATGTITGWGKDDTGNKETGISGFTDPLYWLSNPSDFPTVSGNTCTSPANSDGTLGPTCYLNQTLSAPLKPGVYYYSDDSKFGYSGNVVGTDVTLVFSSNGALPAKAGKTGNATLSLTAPSTGPYSGIVIDAPSYSGELPLDFGSTVTTYNGAVYAPNADLSLQDQGGGIGLTINGALVLGTLDVGDKNKGNLALNGFSSNVPSPLPRISLVE
jgi:hypothetical protein